MSELKVQEQHVYNPAFAEAYDDLHASLHLVDAYTHDPAAIQKVCVSETSSFYLALLDEKAVGMATLVKPFDSIGHRTAVIEDVAVRQEYRGRKVGTTMLNYLIEQSTQFGATRIELHSKDVRKEALGLYLGHGFEVIDTRLFRKPI